ncbi:creatinine amidohydrolase [Marmoricola sp. URHA0025 HA25]
MDFLPTATSTDEADRSASIAVLPVGSFEQHGSHLPLATDAIVACTIAKAVSEHYDLMLLPPITISCSHEHSDFAGTVSISAPTLHAVIRDIADSLERGGIRKLILVNGHGGNYVLGNVVQEANVGARRMALFPHRDDWEQARKAGGLVTSNHEDMHGGELETSILLHAAPDQVRNGADDWVSPERTHLHQLGVGAYSRSGIVGRPSLASADKGRLVLDELVRLLTAHLEHLKQ